MNNRLDFLKRRNAGRRLLPDLRDKLAGLFKVSSQSLNFLSLKESDEIRDRAGKSFASRVELERSCGEYPFISKRVMNVETSKPLLPNARTDVFVIIPTIAETVGVLRVEAATVSRNWEGLLNSTSDGFILVDVAFLNKVVVYKEKDEMTGRDVLDFAAWGEEWRDALRNLLETLG